MSLWVKELRVVDSNQNVNKQSDVRLLIELCPIGLVILFKYLMNSFKELRHELVLVNVISHQ